MTVLPYIYGYDHNSGSDVRGAEAMKCRVRGESRRVKRFECLSKPDTIRRRGKASNFDKTTVEDGRSVGPENRGKTRGKRADNVRETWTLVPVGFRMELGSRYQC